MTDWREVIESPDVEIVDICTPPGTHAEIVEAAAAAGKAIVCEKPLAADYAGAARAADAVRRAGVRNAIGFNYRRLPALSLMKQMIDEGARRRAAPVARDVALGRVPRSRDCRSTGALSAARARARSPTSAPT